MSDKYKAACIEYAAAGAEVRRLGKLIGEHCTACYEAQCGTHPEGPASPPIDHLELAYAMENAPCDSGHGYQRIHSNHDDDVEGYLAELCPHCLAAHKAIEQRKEVRKRFGIAKRRISILGRVA